MNKTGAVEHQLTEAEFTAMVIQLAKLRGWRVTHFRASQNRRGQWATAVQGDGVGWPDLFLVRSRTRQVFAAELKAMRGKTTPEQDAWLADMASTGIATFVWRPSDWPEIERVLEHGV